MAEGKFVLGNTLIVVEVEAIWGSSDEVRVVGVFYDLESAKTHMNRYDRWEYDTGNTCWKGWGVIGSYCLITPVHIDTGKLKERIADAKA